VRTPPLIEERAPGGALFQPPAARLDFERVGSRTVVQSALPMGPLRLLTPNNHGHAAWAYTSSLGGGFVDGDEVRLDLCVARGAAAFVSTQGPTRVYRSPHGCTSETRAKVAAGALLALVPDPTACFAGARFESRCEVDLGAGASLVLFDALSAGRSHRNERWAFRRYSSGLRLAMEGRVVLDETVLLDPEHGPLADRLGRFDLLATLLIAGSPLAAAREDISRHVEAAEVRVRSDLVESKSLLGPESMLVRIAAVSIEKGLARMRSHLRFLPALLGDDPFSRRGMPCT
jgi:urease accessory protein